RDVVIFVELAVEREPAVRPRALEHFQYLGEALAALGVWDAVGLVGAGKAAAADAENQPPLADVVERRDLLGKPQRMAQGQHLHGNADVDALGARGNGRRDQER